MKVKLRVAVRVNVRVSIRPGEFDGENDIIGFATNLTLLFRLFFCRLHSQGGDDSKSVRKGESFDEAKASAGGKAIGEGTHENGGEVLQWHL